MSTDRISLLDRRMKSVDRDHPDGCWVWQKCMDRQGYGRTSVGTKCVLAHRWFYEQIIGPIPDGLSLDHLCENRACVNPAHLDPCTSVENTKRGARRRVGRAKYQELIALYESGLTPAEIASRTGLTAKTVYYRIKVGGGKTRPVGRPRKK